jgi:hypothetical protein
VRGVWASWEKVDDVAVSEERKKKKRRKNKERKQGQKWR